ncbi:1,4-beta-xylanase [Maribellus luteus]|uniref:1,4-beta-xylanase n=1 Tax=Maribellus luteus TaxID=2305463 RepID=A0A399SUR7_9BACT|nr:glycoside hydrolase family 2 TIM barrel-domain containing protein [Maribellus luteus]RIJ46454.1 1,4-beta-xylanase [Maribellus luteus]
MYKTNFLIFAYLIIVLFASCGQKKKDTLSQSKMSSELTISAKWSEDKANMWWKSKPWLRGANFNPSTAINQLEFWQEDSFDPETIDRELGWAENIGLNCMRVYLHHVAWEVDNSGFKKRISTYLEIANKHNIMTIFVFFDDCWNANYKAGKQPDPKPGIHNSGWVRDPGDLLFTSDNLMPILETYVKDILETFKNDERIILWDLYNEPGNSGYKNKSLPLLKNVFSWARSVSPEQPLTSGIWDKSLIDLNKFQIENSDIITYHNYSDEILHQRAIDSLKIYNRPMICTEYMARKHNSLFSNIMPILKKQNIGAINWGLVAGKSNTKYAWDEPIPDGSDPELWFHDIFHKDGTPYKQGEVNVIKELCLIQAK